MKPATIDFLSSSYRRSFSADDVMAYIAAVAAHPAYTAKFAGDLRQPGLRIPLTADRTLFETAVALGREVIWLHTFGERFADPATGRPARPPRLPKDEAPRIPARGAIPGAPEPLPDEIDYDAANRRLRIGKGHIDNVSPAVWNYEVSGKHVLGQWFSYRRLDRSRPVIGDRRPPSPLDKVQPSSWPAEYTEELLNVLHVLGRLVALEPRQAELLDEICSHALFTVAKLRAAGALDAPARVGVAAAGNRDQAKLL